MTDTANEALKPIIKFLQHYFPFNQMLPAHQEYLAMSVEQEFYAEHDKIVLPENGIAETLFIIKNGSIKAETKTASKQLKTGQCFPISALLNKRATHFQYQAQSSTICYHLGQSHFEYLMQQSNIFHDFILKQS